MLDQIKRSPLGKLFKQKKEAEHKEASTPEAPVIAEPEVAAAVVVEETPVVAEVVEPTGKFSTFFFFFDLDDWLFFFQSLSFKTHVRESFHMCV